MIGRREFLKTAAGTAALAGLLGDRVEGQTALGFPPTAKRVIYLFQSGAPS
jgi:TAT (twin-arginine translocation) pathway signal sequence